MAPDDVGQYVTWLQDCGLRFLSDGEFIDIAVVDQYQGPTADCAWLNYTRHQDGYGIAWMAGTDQGPLAVPPGWSLEHSLTSTGRFVPIDEVPGRLVPLGNAPGVDSYLDTTTVHPQYVGRPFSFDSGANNVAALHAHAVELARNGNVLEALLACEATLCGRPDSVPVLRLKARLLEQSARFADALVCHDRLCALVPTRARAWFERASLLGRMERYVDAAESFGQATRLDPRHNDSWYFRAVSLERAGAYEDAVVAAEALVQLEPQVARGWFIKAVNLMWLNKRPEAIVAYRTCVGIDPHHATAWSNLGGLLVDSGKPQQAIEALSKAVAQDPADAFAWYHLGRAHELLNRKLEAQASYRQALKQPALTGAARKEVFARITALGG
jgi:tetratricopeptide (TPR) repeat protein